MNFFYLPHMSLLWVAVLIILAIVFVFAKNTWKIWVYIVILLVICIFSRDSNNYMIILDPIWKYRLVLVPGALWYGCEILYNIIMMIPLGGLIYHRCMKLSTKHTKTMSMVYGGFFSIIIETLQYIFHKGTAELNDIINNIVGIIIGMMLFIVFVNSSTKLH